MKILHNLFPQFLALLFLCLLLFKSTFIFAAPEDADKSVNTSSEEMKELKELYEAKKTQEKLTSEAGEGVKEEADIEGKEKPDVIEEVIKKSVVEKKELPDELETAIKSTSEKKEDEEKKEAAPLSSSVENVVSQLDNISTNRDKSIIESFLSEKRSLLHAWNTLATKLNDKLGLKLGLAYTSLYQYATDAKGTKDGAAGDFDCVNNSCTLSL